ncbi:Stp1/IreP family PP2C-type Ser/Thr phosphatase [Halalkalibacter hemicellulosilyticus]|uniref:protein-serine/threonine phosphatase n=1 Tax=Halalkalibacter hemicellulosilyticusJCM 9152 TaxID=1236971 RepID=W4QAW0_9BACI|nr:Stp1/IreP family PP2C-type Ser/Thr phosphatase [Halalkalibacter hemicellulosilyticus]GAE29196.1 protein serine/threonine phosphatase PrpC [Halalkalibacter hemicellulosilyticusJCM 9152]
MEFAFQTDSGMVRPHNEDSGGIFKNNVGILAIVADGMGGHQAGDVASSMTTDYFRSLWEQKEEKMTIDESEKWLIDHFNKLNEKLFHHANEHEECKGMGTTLVVALCTSEYVSIAHIGDSRAYVQNQDGFQLKTNDHSLVQELVNTGQISEEEAEHHPRRNVLLRALGTGLDIKVDVSTFQADESDYVLLCSDGLTNKLSIEDIEEQLQAHEEIEQKANKLIQLANERGGEDNITVAIISMSLVRSDGSSS